MWRKRRREKDDDDLIANIEHLLELYGDAPERKSANAGVGGPAWWLRDVARRLNKDVYKHTACGASVRLLCKVDGDGEYFTVFGVLIGSIVEGSQAETPELTVAFPTTKGEWRDTVRRVENIVASILSEGRRRG